MRPVVRSALLAFALCCAALAQAQAADVRKDAQDDNAKPPAPAPAIATAQDVAKDPAAVWARFFQRADLDSAYAKYDVLDRINPGADSANADDCRAALPQLKSAVEAVPVSIAIRRVAMLCAEALGDNAWAERETAAMGALARHALANGAGRRWQAPIRVLSPRDVYAMLSLLGWSFRYEYYRDTAPQRYFPLVVAAWDDVRKHEVHLEFDFVDAAYRIDRGKRYSSTAFRRNVLASSFVNGQADSGEIAAIDLKAMHDANGADGVDNKIQFLRQAASRGGLMSAQTWIAMCVAHPKPGCGDGLVDALLPLAEARNARGMMLLAMAYATGVGVERDPQAVATLLDAADRRWEHHDASVAFAAIWMVQHGGVLDDFAAARMRTLMASGNVSAEMLLLTVQLSKEPKRALTPAQIAFLQRADFNGQGVGHGLLYDYDTGHALSADSEAELHAAADRGLAAAQRILAARYFGNADDAVAHRAQWLPLMREAAQGGDAFAARVMAADAQDRREWLESAGWLLSAVDGGDLPALYELGQLYETGHEELPGKLADAVTFYEQLAGYDGETATKARRRLATLAVEGQGMKRDPIRAQQWLRVDADADDSGAQVQLAGYYLDGTFGKADPVEGERWLKRAADNGSVEGRSRYGSWLLTHAGDAQTHARGIALLRAAAQDGDLEQVNNLTWYQCVSAFPEVRDPAAGLIAAKRMQREPQSLAPGYLDTVAACYAASGDFATAARLQQQVIDALAHDSATRDPDEQPLYDRLALYRAGKAYVESVQ